MVAVIRGQDTPEHTRGSIRSPPQQFGPYHPRRPSSLVQCSIIAVPKDTADAMRRDALGPTVTRDSHQKPHRPSRRAAYPHLPMFFHEKQVVALTWRSRCGNAFDRETFAPKRAKRHGEATENGKCEAVPPQFAPERMHPWLHVGMNIGIGPSSMFHHLTPSVTQTKLLRRALCILAETDTTLCDAV